MIFSIITVDFLIFVALPGSPVDAYVFSLRGRITKERYDELAKHFGLDKPLYERYLINIRNLITWNFGRSWVAGKDIRNEIMSKLPNTILLMSSAIVLSILIGVFWECYVPTKEAAFWTRH